MKVKEIVRLLETDGWMHVRTTGSHRQFKHPTETNVVTVLGKPADDVAVGTAHSILKKAGLK